jgi:hypothetical protein
MFISFKPTFYSEQRTITTKLLNKLNFGWESQLHQTLITTMWIK